MKASSFVLNINSENPERLTAFYRDVVRLEPDLNSGAGALQLGPGATLIIDGHSEVHGRAKDPERTIFNLFVDDIAAEQATLEAAGVTFLRDKGVEFWGGVISTFEDPDGNFVQLIEFDPSRATAPEAN